MLTLLAAGFGLIMGSFLSVLLERWGAAKPEVDKKGPSRPDWAGIIAGRSECPHCHHILAWYDLVPLASYAALGGKCRYCKHPISPLYPVLELTMAAALASYVFRFGIPSTWYLVDIAILFGLVALFFFDLKYQILPDVIVFTLIGIALLRLVSQRPDLLVNAVATGVLLCACLGLLYLVSRGRWLGLGDVKLAIFIGLLFGYPGAVGVTLLAVWAGALWGVGLMLRGRAHLDTALPFGSFWTAVAIVAIIWPGPVYFLSGLVVPYIR